MEKEPNLTLKIIDAKYNLENKELPKNVYNPRNLWNIINARLHHSKKYIQSFKKVGHTEQMFIDDVNNRTIVDKVLIAYNYFCSVGIDVYVTEFI